MFKNPFSFNGRIRRTEYGITFIIYLVSYFVIAVLGDEEPLLALIIIIPTLWFLWAQGAKRCHDRGQIGWFQIIPFYFFWLIFADGDEGENQYGEDPKGRVPFEAYDFSAKPGEEADNNINTQPE